MSGVSIKKVIPALFDADHLARSALVGICFLSALEGVILSVYQVEDFRFHNQQVTGLTIRQIAFLVAGAMVIAGLVWAGVKGLRQPQIADKCINRLRETDVFRGSVHALAFLILALYVIVFAWGETLRLVIPVYNLLHDMYYPLFLWMFLFCVQAGLFLWVARQHQAGVQGVTNGAFLKPARRRLFFDIAAFLFALSLYGLLLRAQIPGAISFIFRYDLVLLSFPVLFLLYFSFRHSGWVANLIGLSVVLILASFALACLWNTGISEEPVVMGLLPYKDASNYYTEAQQLLNGFPINSWGGRPIFSLFLAVLLRLTGSSLQASLAIMAAITMLCCYAAACEVNRSFGPAPAALTMYLLFIYYRQFIGVTYTESLGLAFGALGLAFLLQGDRTSHFWMTVFGLFLASLAFNVRPGPLFVLPFLALWFVNKFRRSKSIRAIVLPGLISCAVILLPFALNFLMIKSLAVSNNAMFSRFPPTFYGLAMGGKSWDQIYTDHPAVMNLPQDQQSIAIYRLAFQQIRSTPSLFLHGVIKFFTNFFTVQDGVFTFIPGLLELRLALFYLCLFGLGYLFKKHRHPGSLLLLACLVGILLSTPFAPTRDSDRMRTYAAAVPFIIMIPSISLAWLSRHSQPAIEENQIRTNPFRSPAFILSGLLVMCVIVGPFIVKSLVQKPSGLQTDCPPHQGALNIRINQGSYIRIIADSAAPLSHLPDLRMSDLIHSVNEFSYSKAFGREPYQPGMLVLNTLDLSTGKQFWIAVSSAGLPVDGRVVKVCVRQAKGSLFFFANDFEPAGK